LNTLTDLFSREEIFKITIENIVVIVGTFFFGFLSRSLWLFIKAKIRGHKIRKLKKIILEQDKVLTLVSADPYFTHGSLSCNKVNKSLFAPFPDDLLAKRRQFEKDENINPKGCLVINEATSFDGSIGYGDLVEKTGINNLNELIKKHSRIVAEKFINEEDGCLFNGTKYGVYDVKETRSTDEKELPRLRVYLFLTDYFTDRVFGSIYNELKTSGHSIVNTSVETYLRYNCFLCGIGVNSVLFTAGRKKEGLVITKRSNRVGYNKDKYHISMNEALSITDIDQLDQVRLDLCLERGFKEELGIDTNELLEVQFCDFFLEKENFQIGITSYVRVNLDFETEILPRIAKDKHLEIQEIFEVDISNTREAHDFLSSHKKSFITHGYYTLIMVLLRNHPSLIKIK